MKATNFRPCRFSRTAAPEAQSVESVQHIDGKLPMSNEDVIEIAPLISGLGSWLLLASMHASGTVSTALCIAAVATFAACLGALLTHYPSRSKVSRQRLAEVTPLREH